MESTNGAAPLARVLGAGVAVVAVLAILCGWLGYRAHHNNEIDRYRVLLVQVAKQGAVNLTTIDYQHADADVARILDSSTGEFYDDFKNRSGPFIEVAKKVRSTTVGTVTEAGLESANDQEGQVLVAVTVNTRKGGVADEQPRYWRMRMTVSRTGDDLKVSKVAFVP